MTDTRFDAESVRWTLKSIVDERKAHWNVDWLATQLLAALDRIDALQQESARDVDLIKQVAQSGVEFSDPRTPYLVVQIDAGLWKDISDACPVTEASR